MIIYSQGYRFDFEERKIVKVGAFFFRTQPESCEIYFNDELVKKTNFLTGTSFIQNIIPKKYKVRIEKEGYSSWEKNLSIEEGMVVEAKNIILFPEVPNFSISFSNIRNYFFSPDGKKIIFEKQNSEKFWELFNLEEDAQDVLLTSKDLGQEEVDFLDIEWSFDSERILITTENEYFIVSTTEENQTSSLEHLEEIKNISFNPRNSQEIFFLKEAGENKSLFKDVYLEEKELSDPIIKNLVTYKLSDKDIFWLSPDGFLYKSDYFGKRLGVLNIKPFSVNKESEYKIEIITEDNVFLKEGNSLYLLNKKSKTFEGFLGYVEDTKISPTNNKLCLFNNYEIWILFLTDFLDQPYREAGEKTFLTRFSQPIDEIYWLSSDYLIFNTGDKIKIAEIDNRDKVNIIKVGEFKEPKIFWNKEYRRLYVLSEGNLYTLENLLP